jgi:SAM-dependent methyltransferase
MRLGAMPNDNGNLEEIHRIYARRFHEFEIERDRVWQVLAAHYFQKWVSATDSIIDVGAGYCEFINNIKAKNKFALDLNPVTRLRASAKVTVLSQDVCQSWPVESNAIDVVFSSNFFEHLHTKEDLNRCLQEASRVLRPGGLIITMGPNIRFCADLYWDFFDHYLPLSDRSMTEVLELVGFEKEIVIPRFLPFTMAGKRPPAAALVRLYLSMPIFWRVFGKQFLIVGRKPTTITNDYAQGSRPCQV